MLKTRNVVIIGAAGAQAQAMLLAAARAGPLDGWLALDRSWTSQARAACDSLGVVVGELDLFSQPDELRELASAARLVANFAGPYYRTGGVVLDACIEAGSDYLDICDDADATLMLLERDASARTAGVRALVGMGSSPGITNVLIRAAVDHLGGADRIELAWVVDVADVGNAALQHFWHIFAPIGPDGRRRGVPAWTDLNRKRVSFPEPLGDQIVVELAHPEPITVPRFLAVSEVRNFGSIAPEDALVVNWALARLGASVASSENPGAGASEITDLALRLYENYKRRHAPAKYRGGGLVVEVSYKDVSLRFSSADKLSMEEATGVPAAAGIDLMLNGGSVEAGVFAPECLQPSQFFSSLAKVSRQTGSLRVHRQREGRDPERVRVRELLASG